MPLKVAKLRYVSLGAEPGWTRRRVGRGFAYYTVRGHRIVDPARLERIRRLAVPPAWRDVWICADSLGHVQATGRDARGRLQYRYHLRWSEARGAQKFAELGEFCRVLPALRRRVTRDLRGEGLSKPGVLATIVALIEKGHLRVGNDEYTRQNGSHGVTTLERRHVHVEGEHIELHYRGKSGVTRHITVDDARLARMLRRCLALPGRRLFRYIDGDGRARRVTSHDVNDYLRDAGSSVTAKYFRTWAASLCCLARLAGHEPPASATAGKRAVAQVVREVAQRLGHTPAVCRASYVHPTVIESFHKGELATIGARAAVRDSEWQFAGAWPRAAEKALVDLLAP